MRADADAYELIVTMKEFKLKRVTSVGLITWNRHNSESTIDLTCMTALLRDSTIETGTAEDMDNYSDHHSVKTILNLRTRAAEPSSTRNWRKMDVEALREELKKRIANSETLSPIDGTYNNQAEGIDRQVRELIEAIQEAIEISTPTSKPSVYAKPGFTIECKQASRNAKAARRRYQQNGKPEYL